jgi:hypothetical protein
MPPASEGAPCARVAALEGAALEVCNENVAMGSFPETAHGSLLLMPVNIARRYRKRKSNSNPKT